MNLTAVLTFGFFLGMRHATDADHVVAVSTIVSRERSLRAATPIGILWGIGHTITILLVGGAIVFFGIIIPPRVGLGMELCVALMLVLLGGLNLYAVLRDGVALTSSRSSALASRQESHPHAHISAQRRPRSLRPLAVGVIHGLAGSAAVTLLVLSAIHETVWAIGYLLVFGSGTIAGMLLITTLLAMPIAAAARRFERLHRALVVMTGAASVVFGIALVYEIGFVHGLFTGHPEWRPE